jgi:hypothetical protein
MVKHNLKNELPEQTKENRVVQLQAALISWSMPKIKPSCGSAIH